MVQLVATRSRVAAAGWTYLWLITMLLQGCRTLCGTSGSPSRCKRKRSRTPAPTKYSLLFPHEHFTVTLAKRSASSLSVRATNEQVLRSECCTVVLQEFAYDFLPHLIGLRLTLRFSHRLSVRDTKRERRGLNSTRAPVVWVHFRDLFFPITESSFDLAVINVTRLLPKLTDSSPHQTS